ncbi:MAG TPA: Uma2 family endonuclease [Thermoanaerobaculia bacterium]|nr:Uma2 family endonuclease [Thermoanaerobaculia bacterium]
MSLPQAREALLTGEDLYRRPDLGSCELVNGRVIPMAPTGRPHATIESRLTSRLQIWADETGRGEVMNGEAGIYIRRSPDTVRAADLLFMSHERCARCSESGYLDVAPELVVEVLSPEDRWSYVTEKIDDYFSAGVERVWIVDPRKRGVLVYHSPSVSEAFTVGEILRDESLLPGFSLDLSYLFQS